MREIFSFKRIISLVVVVCFLTTNAMAMPVETPAYGVRSTKLEKTFNVPAGLGSIVETYTVPEEAYGVRRTEQITRRTSDASRRTVIYIQDAHDSLEAQENIAAMVRLCVKEYGVKTVYEEGYEGPVPTDKLFGEIKDAALKEKVSYYLMDKLRIGGAEYAHINRTEYGVQSAANKKTSMPSAVRLPPYANWRLVGADSINLHLANVRAYEQAAKNRTDVTKDIGRIRKELQKLIDKNFPKEMKEWLTLKSRYQNGQLPLVEYLQRTYGAQRTEYGARKNASQDAVRLPPYLAIEALLSGDPKKIKQIDLMSLLAEIKRMEDEIVEAGLPAERDQKTYGYYQSVLLLEKLNTIELSHEEFIATKESLESLRTEDVARFIAEESHRSVVLFRSWESLIADSIRFYELAKKRDLAIEKILQQGHAPRAKGHEEQSAERESWIVDRGTAPEVLVFGGFHKEAVKRILKEKGISYVILSPSIGAPSKRHEDYYRMLMSGGAHPFERIAQSTAEGVRRNNEKNPDTPYPVLRTQNAARQSTRAQSAFTMNYTSILDRLASLGEPFKALSFPDFNLQLDNAVRSEARKVEATSITDTKIVFKGLRDINPQVLPEPSEGQEILDEPFKPIRKGPSFPDILNSMMDQQRGVFALDSLIGFLIENAEVGVPAPKNNRLRWTLLTDRDGDPVLRVDVFQDHIQPKDWERIRANAELAKGDLAKLQDLEKRKTAKAFQAKNYPMLSGGGGSFQVGGSGFSKFAEVGMSGRPVRLEFQKDRLVGMVTTLWVQVDRIPRSEARLDPMPGAAEGSSAPKAADEARQDFILKMDRALNRSEARTNSGAWEKTAFPSTEELKGHVKKEKAKGKKAEPVYHPTTLGLVTRIDLDVFFYFATHQLGIAPRAKNGKLRWFDESHPGLRSENRSEAREEPMSAGKNDAMDEPRVPAWLASRLDFQPQNVIKMQGDYRDVYLSGNSVFKIRRPDRKLRGFWRHGILDFNEHEYRVYLRFASSIPLELQGSFARIKGLYRSEEGWISEEEAVLDFDGHISKSLRDNGKVKSAVFWERLDLLAAFMRRSGIHFLGFHTKNVLVKKLTAEKAIPVLVDLKRAGLKFFLSDPRLWFRSMRMDKMERAVARLKAKFMPAEYAEHRRSEARAGEIKDINAPGLLVYGMSPGDYKPSFEEGLVSALKDGILSLDEITHGRGVEEAAKFGVVTSINPGVVSLSMVGTRDGYKETTTAQDSYGPNPNHKYESDVAIAFILDPRYVKKHASDFRAVGKGFDEELKLISRFRDEAGNIFSGLKYAPPIPWECFGDPMYDEVWAKRVPPAVIAGIIVGSQKSGKAVHDIVLKNFAGRAMKIFSSQGKLLYDIQPKAKKETAQSESLYRNVRSEMREEEQAGKWVKQGDRLISLAQSVLQSDPEFFTRIEKVAPENVQTFLRKLREDKPENEYHNLLNLLVARYADQDPGAEEYKTAPHLQLLIEAARSAKLRHGFTSRRRFLQILSMVMGHAATGGLGGFASGIAGQLANLDELKRFMPDAIRYFTPYVENSFGTTREYIDENPLKAPKWTFLTDLVSPFTPPFIEKKCWDLARLHAPLFVRRWEEINSTLLPSKPDKKADPRLKKHFEELTLKAFVDNLYENPEIAFPDIDWTRLEHTTKLNELFSALPDPVVDRLIDILRPPMGQSPGVADEQKIDSLTPVFRKELEAVRAKLGHIRELEGKRWRAKEIENKLWDEERPFITPAMREFYDQWLEKELENEKEIAQKPGLEKQEAALKSWEESWERANPVQPVAAFSRRAFLTGLGWATRYDDKKTGNRSEARKSD
ncbi:MAG: hypothetical protein WC133_07190, partial [Candidatus Omnitrophota bacterium]